MANSTIPGLAAVTVPALTDLFGVRQSGDTRDKKLTVTQLLTLVPGGGDVTKVGTPVNNQLGVWTGDGTIEGDANLAWSGTILTVGGTIRVANNGGGAILNEQVTSSNPSIIPDVGDVDTGFGSGGTNNMVVILGGSAYATWRNTGAGDGSLEATYDLTTGKAASTTQTQGQATQNSPEYSEITTVANPNDVITLGAVAAGRKITIVNSGANVLQIFPTLGDDLGQGVNASTTLAVGHSITFFGLDAINWSVIGLSETGTGNVTKVGTPVNNQIGIWTGDGTLEGTTAIQFDGSTFTMNLGGGDLRLTGKLELQGSNRPAVLDESTSNTNPVFAPLGNSPTSGLGGQGSSVSLIAFSKAAIVATSLNSQILQGYQASTALTAFATGGQTNAVILGSSYNVLATVATTGDSVKLPVLFVAGDPATVIYIKNDGANAADVFPGLGDDLGAGLNTAESLAAGASVSYIATAGSTWTKWIVDTSGSGDVVKVGTPVNNQIGVWTGDGTLEGDANFLLTGTQLTLPSGSSAGLPELKVGPGETGLFSGSATQLRITVNGTERFTVTNNIIQGFLAGSGQLHNRVSSATVPTFTPNTNDGDTGIGGPGGDVLSLIAGGVEGFTVAEAAAVITNTYRGNVVGNGGGGAAPMIKNESPSSTNPTLCPNQADPDTGLGRSGVDRLDLIAGGLSCMSVRETAAARQIGFYTTAPISQQTGVAVTDVAIHAALVALGLITA